MGRETDKIDIREIGGIQIIVFNREKVCVVSMQHLFLIRADPQNQMKETEKRKPRNKGKREREKKRKKK